MRWRRADRTPLADPPDCEQVGAVLQSYLDGELGADDGELVAAHLEHCRRCGIEADTIRQVIDAIRRQRPDLDGAVLDRLRAEVDRLTGSGSPPEPR